MTNRHDRLRTARKAAGFKSARAAAMAFDWNYETYKHNENGNAPFSFEAAKLYAERFDVSPMWLYHDDFEASGAHKIQGSIPILGKVAANGDSYHLLDDLLPGHEVLEGIAIEGAAGALPVAGDSMWPRYRDGEMVVIGPQRKNPRLGDMGTWLYEDVVAQISDGRVVLKTLEPSEKGRFTLSSINGAYKRITDVDLDWVARVLWVRRA